MGFQGLILWNFSAQSYAVLHLPSRGFQCVALNLEWFGVLDSNSVFRFKWKKGNAIKYVLLMAGRLKLDDL